MTKEQCIAEIIQEEEATKARETAQLDSLLGVLRKHNVKEFYDKRITVTFDSAEPPPRFSGVTMERTETDGPPAGAVEPTQHDLDDVLFGAK